MEKSKLPRHTPGPWQSIPKQISEGGHASRYHVQDCKGRVVGNRQADSALMAASPELAEMVLSLLDLVEMQELQLASALEIRRQHSPLVAEGRRLMLMLRTKGVVL